MPVRITYAISSCSKILRGLKELILSATQPVGTELSSTDSARKGRILSLKFQFIGKAIINDVLLFVMFFVMASREFIFKTSNFKACPLTFFQAC